MANHEIPGQHIPALDNLAQVTRDHMDIAEAVLNSAPGPVGDMSIITYTPNVPLEGAKELYWDRIVKRERFKSASNLSGRARNAVGNMYRDGLLSNVEDLRFIPDSALLVRDKVGPGTLAVIREKYPYHPTESK